ncbi:FAD-binding domain-containing protein [Peniophora sp. CONT]|nr:FAD-binding domain-containing protein [Peniophora sp. CONT]
MMIASLLALSSLALLAKAGSTEDACSQIRNSISSSSEVFYPGSDGYAADIYHWSLACTRNSTCSVEPGTAEDVSKILGIISESRVPFAIKGGGHSLNPGFTSTPGIQIAMSRFKQVTLNDDKSIVAIGAGCVWGDVYTGLNGTGRVVVGGRGPGGIGVAGFILGGGYGYHTGQYGLAMDNVAAFDIVLPNGTEKHVTAADKDLWFALRGAGAANFGIVTTFHLYTHPQGDVWGGLVLIDASQLSAMSAAAARFIASNTDPKAVVIPGYHYGQGMAFSYVMFFYDGPAPPAGLFDELITIPSLFSDLVSRDYATLINSVEKLLPTLPETNVFLGSINVVGYPVELLEYMQEVVSEAGEKIKALDPESFLSIYVEPMTQTYFSNATDTSPAAYPASRDQALFPSMTYYGFKDASQTDAILESLQDTVKRVRAKAVELGQDVAHVGQYPNYALFTTPTVELYGAKNLARLQEIQKVVDPKRVFDLTGGFRLREADVEEDFTVLPEVADQVPVAVPRERSEL